MWIVDVHVYGIMGPCTKDVIRRGGWGTEYPTSFIPKVVNTQVTFSIGGGMGGGRGAVAPLGIWGEGPTYTLAPLEFLPDFD